MNTFVKVLLFALAAWFIFHFWPIAFAPFLVAAGAVLVVGSILAGGAALTVSVVIAVLGALLGLICTIAAVLSPIWIPVVFILGIIALVRRSSRVTQ